MTLLADGPDAGTTGRGAASAVDAIQEHLLAQGIAGVRFDVAPIGVPGAGSAIDGDVGLVYPVRIYSGSLILGPLHRADGSTRPCARCLERRWHALRPVEERRALDAGADIGGGGVPLAGGPALPSFVLDLLAEVVRTETGPQRVAACGTGRGRVIELALRELTLTRHELIADSECERCAAPVEDTPERAELPLRPQPKRSVADYRLRPAAELALPTDAYVNPVCGVLGGATMPIYQCSATLPVSGFFRVRSRFDYHEMWWTGQAQSLASSECYGLLEGLERYAGQFPRSMRSSTYDTWANLQPHAIDPTTMGSYQPEFYLGHSDYYEPFGPDVPIHWVWGYSLTEQRAVLVPEQLVFYLDRRPEKKFVQECSNGCASGTSVEEAALHGMLELVERDAFLLSWYAGARLPEIDAATCADPEVQFVLDRVARLGYRMRLFDMRVDIPVPAVLAVAENRDAELGTLCFAAGASFDPVQAVRSAIAETASYIPGLDDRVRAKLPLLHEMTADFNVVHELTHHALLYGLPEMAHVADFLFDGARPHAMDSLYRDWLRVRPATMDLTDDVRYLIEAINATGSDVIAVDQTCPEQHDAGVRTLSVLAGGLVPIDFGWERQRVLGHPRLDAYLAGELDTVHAPEAGFGPTGRNVRPHPFP